MPPLLARRSPAVAPNVARRLTRAARRLPARRAEPQAAACSRAAWLRGCSPPTASYRLGPRARATRRLRRDSDSMTVVVRVHGLIYAGADALIAIGIAASQLRVIATRADDAVLVLRLAPLVAVPVARDAGGEHQDEQSRERSQCRLHGRDTRAIDVPASAASVLPRAALVLTPRRVRADTGVAETRHCDSVVSRERAAAESGPAAEGAA